MATETVNTIWPEEFESESTREDSITSRDLLENAEHRPLVYKMTWGGNSVWSFTKGKRIDSVEEAPELEQYPARNLEEALSNAHTFFRLGTLLGGYSRFSGIFIHTATGVISGNIPEPKTDVLVRVARDVIEKSKANGWCGELNTAIELVKATYTTLKKIELLLEKDPEIPDRETLRFIFTVTGRPEQILEEEDEFEKRIRNKIGENLREIITLTYYWK